MAQFYYDKCASLRNIRLRLLEYSVQDNRSARIFDELSRSMALSEKMLEDIALNTLDNENYLDEIAEEENSVMEDLIGTIFLLLQIKIARIRTAAKPIFESRYDVFGVNGNYEMYQFSIVRLIWEIANYYKHRDAWPDAQHKITRGVAEELGLLTAQSGNMRVAFEKLGIKPPYSKCDNLLFHVQEWAEEVLRAARDRVRRQNSQRRAD